MQKRRLSISGSGNGLCDARIFFWKAASRRLLHVDFRFQFSPERRLRWSKVDVERPVLNKIGIFRTFLNDLMEFGHPYSEHHIGSRRSPSNNVKKFINLELSFELTLVSILTMGDPLINGRQRPVTNNWRPFRNTFLSNVVASYCSFLFKYHITICFIFKTCNLQPFPDAVALEADGAPVLHP